MISGWSDSRRELKRQKRIDDIKFLAGVIMSGLIVGSFIFIISLTFVNWICG